MYLLSMNYIVYGAEYQWKYVCTYKYVKIKIYKEGKNINDI